MKSKPRRHPGREPRRAAATTASSAGRRRPLAALCIVGAAAFACYVQTLGYGFVYDDGVQIARNPRIRSFANVGQAFGENVWAFNSPQSFTNYYRPLQTLAYMAAYSFGGLDPGPYHALNVVLHVAASAAGFWAGLELLRRTGVAMAGALLFAVHPIHTESVAWIAGITDVGCALFFFVAAAAHLRLRRQPSRPLAWRALEAGAFGAALLFKETALALPLVLAAADLLLRPVDAGERKAPIALLARTWGPMAAVLVVYTLLRVHALGVFARTVHPLPLGPVDRLLTLAWFLGSYIAKLVLPLQQNAYHVFRPVSQLSVLAVIVPLAVFAAAAFATWRFLRREPELLFLAAWTVLTLVPVLSFGSVGQNVFTERYLYIPSLGLALLVPAAIAKRFGTRAALSAAAAMAALLTIGTFARNPVWRDDRTFYSTTLAASPDAAPLHNNFGKLLFDARDLAGAERSFQAAAAANARAFAPSAEEAYNSRLGSSAVRAASGDLDGAWKLAEESRRSLPHRGSAYQTLGMILGRKGEYAEAARLLERGLQLGPADPTAHANLANVFVALGRLEEAERQYHLALELEPRGIAARVGLAAVYERRGLRAEALRLLDEALAADPSSAAARALRARIAPSPR